MKHLKRHEKVDCEKISREIYPGGFYKPPQTLFQELSENGFDISENMRYFPFFAFYDFESILDTSYAKDQGKNTKIQARHVPISFAVTSNVNRFTCQHKLEGEETCEHCKDLNQVACYIDPDQDSLIDKLVSILEEYQACSSEVMRIKFHHVISSLHLKIDQAKERLQVCSFFVITRWRSILYIYIYMAIVII